MRERPGESDLDAFVSDLQARLIRDAREVYSEEVIRRWLDTPHVGVMKDPDAHARVTGPCGDTMEVFLAIREGRVARASFYTDGCASTIACGSMTCDLALGKTIAGLREVTQEAILEALGGWTCTARCLLRGRSTRRFVTGPLAASGKRK